MSERDEFLTKIRTAAAENGGKPLGAKRFFQRFGLSPDHLWAAGFESYGAACAAANLQPNTLTPRLSDEELFRPLAILTRQLGKFPPKGAFEVARKRDPAFPSWEAYTRRKTKGPERSLREALANWCAQSSEFNDVAALLTASPEPARKQPTDSRPVVNGYVYLMRYGTSGTIFKIGISEDVVRRHAQISMVNPQDVRVIHAIPTDDPLGIEAYWHNRFRDKRLEGKKELFKLSVDDVTAFRRRRYQ